MVQDISTKGKYRPKLSRKPLTFRGPFDDSLPSHLQGSAISAFNYDIADVLPAIRLERIKEGQQDAGHDEKENWNPKKDLLESGEFSNHFMVEQENDGTAYIRFNDSNPNFQNEATNKKEEGSFHFYATYRVGNGRRGNVGACIISRIVVNLYTSKIDNVLSEFNRYYKRKY